MMMGTETVPETSVIFNQPRRLIVREDFIDSKIYFKANGKSAIL
jgi:hypothetical protein